MNGVIFALICTPLRVKRLRRRLRQPTYDAVLCIDYWVNRTYSKNRIWMPGGQVKPNVSVFDKKVCTRFVTQPKLHFICLSFYRGRRDSRDDRGRGRSRDEDEEEEVLIFEKTEKPTVTG